MAQIMRRPSPFAELAGLGRMFEDMMQTEPTARQPAIDVLDRGNELVVRAEMPGLRPEEVNVEAQDGVLTIRGQHEEQKEDRESRFVRRERRVEAFARSIVLPPDTDEDAIQASADNGVLEVHIPRRQQAQPRSIQVQAGQQGQGAQAGQMGQTGQTGQTGQGAMGGQAQQPESQSGTPGT